MSTTALKLSALAIRTLAKPIATRIKSQARDHPHFRKICISIAQRIHQVDMRLRLGLLRDTSATLDKSEASATRRRHADALQKMKEEEAIYPGVTGRVRSDVPVPTGEETGMKGAAATTTTTTTGDAHRAADGKAAAPAAKPRIRPLSETKAIDAGANFISEAFLFAVAASVILVENLRSRRKEASRRDTVRERLELLEARKRQDEMRLGEQEVRIRELEQKLGSSVDARKTWVPTPLWEPKKVEGVGKWWGWGWVGTRREKEEGGGEAAKVEAGK